MHLRRIQILVKPFAHCGFGSDIDSRWETETADFNAARRE
jgi:hypothetical protein